jgi:hypothetical protein
MESGTPSKKGTGLVIGASKCDMCGRREFVDLQLPYQEQEYVEIPIEIEPEPVVKEFKEKVVESLGNGETSFKKRKIVGGAKRNTRQRLDDD